MPRLFEIKHINGSTCLILAENIVQAINKATQDLRCDYYHIASAVEKEDEFEDAMTDPRD